MRTAHEPFQFIAASYLTRIRTERAVTLAEMAVHLRHCSGASIFYHTYQSLEAHHYSVFSSDFAQWVMAACNENALAEKLAAVDLLDYVNLEEVRTALVTRIEQHINQNPDSATRKATQRFHFCEAVEMTVPLATRAHTLAEMIEGIRHMSLQTLHYHFINSRLRLRLQTTDFSNWLANSLGLPELAEQVNRLPFSTSTLEQVRDKLLDTLQPWVDR